MGNPSTVWTQLALPNPPAKAIPFVDDDNATIIVDVLSFYYNKASDSTLNGTILPAQLTVLNGLRVNYKDITGNLIANNANVVVNNISMRVGLATGCQTFTITNNLVFASSQILYSQVFKEGAIVAQIVPANGSFTVTMSAPTGAPTCVLDFTVISRF